MSSFDHSLQYQLKTNYPCFVNSPFLSDKVSLFLICARWARRRRYPNVYRQSDWEINRCRTGIAPYHILTSNHGILNYGSPSDNNLPLHARKGVYVDLGTLEGPDDTSDNDLESYAKTTSDATDDAIKEWRSKHWIVVIDDESSIRLAIGDYLYSMGYELVTACDGPLSFLEMLLWTCGWSFLDTSPINLKLVGSNERPPWLENANPADNKHPWRLPSVVISDIRMPGGIDGVQLLELLREHRSPSKRDVKNTITPIEKNRRRRKKKKLIDEKDNEDDSTDQSQIPDPSILEGWVEFATPIATPVDHVKKILDAIHNTVEQCKKAESTPSYPEQIKNIPIILLTAKAMVSDRIKGYKAGADGYLPKPFRPEELLRLVDNLIRRQDRELSASLMKSLYEVDDNNDAPNSNIALSLDEIEEITKELREIKLLLVEVTSSGKAIKYE